MIITETQIPQNLTQMSWEKFRFVEAAEFFSSLKLAEKWQTTTSQFPVIPFKAFLHAWNVFAGVTEKDKLVLTRVQ